MKTKFLIGMILIVSWMTACVRPLEDPQGTPGEVRGSFALSLKNVDTPHSPVTKMDGTIVQSTGNFRGIERIYAVPFHTETVNGTARAVDSDDERLGGCNLIFRRNDIDSLIPNNNAHLFDLVVMPNSMNRVLVYGNVPDERVSGSEKERKIRNGVLHPVNLDDPSRASDISFSLESILNETESSQILATADGLIDALNFIVAMLKQSGDSSFDKIYPFAENQIWACSYQTLYSMLEDLYSAFFYYHGDGTEAINFAMDSLTRCLDRAGSTFPASYGIPEGAVGFWWNGKEFRRLINGVNVNLVSLDKYSFPPSLWYFVDSPVRTSNENDVIDEYKPENTNWSNILDHYGDGGTVVHITRAVAIDQQLQYGVGMLSMSLSGKDTSLLWGCPLTGVIVGDQNDVDFEFQPILSTDGCRYVYDPVSVDLTLGDLSPTKPSVPILLLPTVERDSVHFALEFKNTTSDTLRCHQGLILPGCRFYVAGILNPTLSSISSPSGQPTLSKVFCQDRMTTVSVTISSLINAYNTVPDLYDPQLEVGIVAEMNWIPVTPQSVKLYF